MSVAAFDIQRILASCQPLDKNGCLIWTGRKNRKGYGTWGKDYAHRIMYELCKGPIPKGLVVMHTCDVRDCIQPDHLLIGTVHDNTMDMVHKKRHRWFAGADNGNAKLTIEQVQTIRLERAQGVTLKALAKKYGVGFTAIHKIVMGLTWK